MSSITHYTTKFEPRSVHIWMITFVLMIVFMFVLTLMGRVSGQEFISLCSILTAGIFSQMQPKGTTTKANNMKMKTTTETVQTPIETPAAK